MPQEIDSTEGLTLSLQVFSSMVGAHMELQLQHETRMIVEQRTNLRADGAHRQHDEDYGAYSLTRTR